MNLPYELALGDTIETARSRPDVADIDLLVFSPPYNIGKAYETRTAMPAYEDFQREVLEAWLPKMSRSGHVCIQVGNYVDGRTVLPLDFVFIRLMQDAGLKLRNRIVWRCNHGLHARHRFSGRHETILWATISDDYRYDPVGRFNDPRAAEQPFNDVWDNIPNVKSNHVEKTGHPCQYPVGLAERLVLALTTPDDLVVDPFAGVASAGVAALLHGRRFFGAERDPTYHATGVERLNATLAGTIRYRPHDREIYTPRPSEVESCRSREYPRFDRGHSMAQGTLTRELLEQAFERIGALASSDGKVCDIAVYGGASLMLASDIRNATGDVDAVFMTDESALYAYADKVGSELSLPRDWLNQAVKVLAPPKGGAQPNLFHFGEYPRSQNGCVGLRVYLPSPGYLLAMKLLANRPSEDVSKIETDLEDIISLMAITELTTAEQLVDLMRKCYPRLPGMDQASLPRRLGVKIETAVDRFNNEHVSPTWNAGRGPATR